MRETGQYLNKIGAFKAGSRQAQGRLKALCDLLFDSEIHMKCHIKLHIV